MQAHYADLYESHGCIYKLAIDSAIEPTRLPERKVSESLMQPLKDLQAKCIKALVQKSTGSISSLVIVERTIRESKNMHKLQSTKQSLEKEALPHAYSRRYFTRLF